MTRRAWLPTLALAAFLGCGGTDVSDAPEFAADATAGSHAARWTETRGHCGAIADTAAVTPDCDSFPSVVQGPGGECSLACFADAAGVHLALGCAACSSSYDVTFAP